MKPEIKLSGYLCFDPSDPIYQVHFPSFAIVPGSLIIHAFERALIKKSLLNRSFSVRNFRFRRFISPGEYRFEIIGNGDIFKCILYDGRNVAVSGEIES